jgi:hypothetical protein
MGDASSNERENVCDRKRNDLSVRVAIIIALVVLAFSIGVATRGVWLAIG